MNKPPTPPEILHMISLLPLEDQEEIRLALNEQWEERLNGELIALLEDIPAPQCSSPHS